MFGTLQRQRAVTILLEFSAVRDGNSASFVDEIIESGFALTSVGITTGITPTTDAEIPVWPIDEDIMLMLSR